MNVRTGPLREGADEDPAVGWTATTVATESRQVPIRLFRPTRASDLWLVWAHGGSWTGGSVGGAWHHACADLARLAGGTVVSVDYRLAPRHRHPAALHDVLDVMDWAQRQADREQPGSRIAVGGDSAGGTLASCAALVWRDRHRPLGAQVLAYPPIDPECDAASYRTDPASFPTRGGLVGSWEAYRGPGYRFDASTGHYSTPAEAADLTDVAPAVLVVGSRDPVADDVRAYAERLTGAAVPVSFREFPQLGHGVFLRPPTQSSGRDRAADDPLRSWLGATLREVLNRPRDFSATTQTRRAMS
ncbi:MULTISPECIES: alpha/beta hydrolase [unclassified Micromonospora]|uniref:alpha/beta hydrolase n=1 Tax=unclassified Micromonospora TaxID=2617518 RepID=UPI00362E3EB0